MILSAAGDGDVGPDVSLAHAEGKRLDAEALKAMLTGKSLLLGTALARGPFTWQLHDDGTLAVLVGTEHRPRWSGSWRIDDRARYCRTLDDGEGNPGADILRERCFDVVVKDRAFRFFDADGLMQFDTEME